MHAKRHEVVDRRRDLLRLLADGELHSGAELARQLGVSRTAVWQHARELGELGLAMSAVRGSGYRLDAPIDLLDATAILGELSADVRADLRELQVLFSTDSTNQRLLDAGPGDVHACACVAEMQTAGRGRRGRKWLGAPGRGVYLSLAWRFPSAMQTLAGLSLAAGVCVHRALRSLAAGDPVFCDGLQLKWPNDLLFQEKKLAGVLVEVSGEMQGPCLAVIGVGVNVLLPEAVRLEIGQQPAATAVTDLRECVGFAPSRNRLAALLLGELLRGMQSFQVSGFGAFIGDWTTHDALAGRPISIEAAAGPVDGVACGVEVDGALSVEIGGARRKFHGGEVRVRLNRDPAG